MFDVADWTKAWPESESARVLSAFLGGLIGEGIHRAVYECAYDEKFVVKVAKGVDGVQANCKEFDLWNASKHTKWANWFAPCKSLLGQGKVLIQRKTKPIYEIPERVPSFFTDLKPENWGRIGKRLVCHDYGLNLANSVALGSARMRKAEIWT